MPSNARQVVDILFFENVTSADSGIYMCTARNDIGIDVKVIHVIVKGNYDLISLKRQLTIDILTMKTIDQKVDIDFTTV